MGSNYIWCPKEKVSRYEGIVASGVGPNRDINICIHEGCTCDEFRIRMGEISLALVERRQAEREAAGEIIIRRHRGGDKKVAKRRSKRFDSDQKVDPDPNIESQSTIRRRRMI